MDKTKNAMSLILSFRSLPSITQLLHYHYSILETGKLRDGTVTDNYSVL